MRNDYGVNMIRVKHEGVAVTPAAQTPRAYHHGDLRNALVEAGLQLLASRSADALSLRELARTVGVSATAIYRHFPDKAALQAALVAEGLERLGARQRLATLEAGGGNAGFLASGLAYVRFAVANPALFRLVFSQPHALDWLVADPCEVPAPMRGLREDIHRLIPAQVAQHRRQAWVLQAWALVHGLAMLWLDQQIEPDWASVEQALMGFGQAMPKV